MFNFEVEKFEAQSIYGPASARIPVVKGAIYRYGQKLVESVQEGRTEAELEYVALCWLNEQFNKDGGGEILPAHVKFTVRQDGFTGHYAPVLFPC